MELEQQLEKQEGKATPLPSLYILEEIMKVIKTLLFFCLVSSQVSYGEYQPVYRPNANPSRPYQTPMPTEPDVTPYQQRSSSSGIEITPKPNPYNENRNSIDIDTTWEDEF